jgi:hypothetical protein
VGCCSTAWRLGCCAGRRRPAHGSAKPCQR